MTVVPISEYTQQGQPQMHGKIRLGGHKTATAPGRKLRAFRFTSPDEHAIRELAAIYGGEPKPWSDPKANPNDQWEVFTDADQIRVWVPPAGLSCYYETWSGGGCVRRCDGISVEVAQRDDMVTLPCLCKQEGKLTCKPRSRLNVILPDIVFGGVWRCETSGKHAAREMPAMERLIDQLQVRGVVEAVLCLEQAQSEGGQKRYVVPRLRLADSALALVAGNATVGMLHPGARAELGTGTLSEPPGAAEGPIVGIREQAQEWFDADDEVIDAEVVEERADGPLHPSVPVEVVSVGAGPPLSAAAPPSRPRTGKLNARETKFLLECTAAAEFVPGTDGDWIRHALCRKVSRGRTASSRALSSDELAEGIDLAMSLVAETMRGTILKDDPPALALEEVVAP